MNLTLMKQSGQNSYTVAQKTSWLLKAKNDSGEVASKELLFDVYDPDNPPAPPEPSSLPVPGNVAGHVSGRILFWTWDDVDNVDKLYFQLYASQTPDFTPDKNPPADMKYRITFGNQTNIVVTGAAETWYGKVRQVARRGKSAFTAEGANISA